jgi:hypothetical protein
VGFQLKIWNAGGGLQNLETMQLVMNDSALLAPILQEVSRDSASTDNDTALLEVDMQVFRGRNIFGSYGCWYVVNKIVSGKEWV